MEKTKKVIKRITGNPAFAIGMLLIFFIILNEIFFNTVFSGSYIKSFFRSNTPLACVAIGTAIVIIGGGIDISLGALLSFVNVMIVQLIMSGMNAWLAALIGLAAGILGGAFNGFFIGILRITPMIATFASMSVFFGLALWVQPTAGGSTTPELKEVYKGDVAGIPNALVLLVLILLITYLIFRSPLGTKILCSGKNAQNAFVSGINVYGVQFFTYVYAGLLAAIGAIAMTASINSGDPTLGASYSMSAIAACVIGGVSLSGGRGNALGAVLGTMFLALLTSIVVSANVDSCYQDLLKGSIMFIALIVAAVLTLGKTLVKKDASGNALSADKEAK